MHSSLILTITFLSGALATFNGYQPQGLPAKKSLKARQGVQDSSDVSPRDTISANAEYCGTDGMACLDSPSFSIFSLRQT
jgi:hypothetical protein